MSMYKLAVHIHLDCNQFRRLNLSMYRHSNLDESFDISYVNLMWYLLYFVISRISNMNILMDYLCFNRNLGVKIFSVLVIRKIWENPLISFLWFLDSITFLQLSPFASTRHSSACLCWFLSPGQTRILSYRARRIRRLHLAISTRSQWGMCR